MSPEQFTYWLKGFAQACPASQPTISQWDLIVSKLNSVKNASGNISLEAFSTNNGDYRYDIPNPNNVIKNKSLLNG